MPKWSIPTQKIDIDSNTRFRYQVEYWCPLVDASICGAKAEADIQSGIFGSSAWKKAIPYLLSFLFLLTYDMSYHATLADFYDPGSKHLWQDLGLDVVGISAYFPLADTPPTAVMSKESLEAKWAEILTDYIVPVKTTNPTLPILFLEFGYTDSVQSPRTPTSQEFETRVFTDENGNGKDDGQETQANIYEAFFSAISSQPGLINGAFLWGHSMMSDATWNQSFGLMREFSVRNKLAESAMSTAYGWKPSSSTSTFQLLLDQ